MKILILLFLISINLSMPVIAQVDKTSAEYLKNKKHFAIINPLAEKVVEKIIKKSLHKEVGHGNYKVRFEGYTLGSMKKGIFKNLEIEGKNLEVDEIPVKQLELKTLTDYNWIDFNETPIKIKSDLLFAYQMQLTEKSINAALKQKDYQKTLEKINKKAYPLFTLHDARVRIKHNKVLVIMDYSLPLASNKKSKTFMVSTDFRVDNGKIKAQNIGIDNIYGNLPLDKVTNLINLLDPLSFTLAQLNNQKCKGNIENVTIKDNIIQINGKINIDGVNSKKN